MGKLFLLAPMQHTAAVVTGAVASDHVSNIIGPAGKRSLSQSLLNSFHTMPKPKPTVDRCWGEMESDDETGEKRPAIKCDFIVPKQ